MGYPPKPSIQTSYTAVEQALGDGSLPGQELDVDFAGLKDAVDALNDFVRGVTRSDGRLANGSVTQDSLAADVLLGIAPPAPWESGRVYRSPQTVFEANRFYLAIAEHVSSVFADDLAAGRWLELADFTAVQAASLAAQIAAEAARDDAEAARDDVVERYLGSFSSPPATSSSGGALQAGMLYFDTSLQAMFVYTGADWTSVSSAVSGVRNVFIYTATSGQTEFDGPDDNSETPVLGSATLVSVYLNGVRLLDTADYTVDTALGRVTLSSGAVLNDVVVIEVFGNFQAQPPESAQVVNLTADSLTVDSLTVDASTFAQAPVFTDAAGTRAALGLGSAAVEAASAFATAAQGALADTALQSVPALTQTQAEDSTSTVFGTVSGQRLAQAVVANVPGPTTAEVLAATAGADAGAVGTYVFATRTGGVGFGDVVSASTLAACGAIFQRTIGGSGSPLTTNTPSGSWRCMGRLTGYREVSGDDFFQSEQDASLFLRIS